MKYGFTGTRSGLTDSQKNNIITLLTNDILDGKSIEVHHGDCIGADKDFHDICNTLISDYNKLNKYIDIKIIIHPPTQGAMRDFCKSDNVEQSLPYLQRNKKIVEASDILIACPYSKIEQLRSGTWATIRYATKQKKQVSMF